MPDPSAAVPPWPVGVEPTRMPSRVLYHHLDTILSGQPIPPGHRALLVAEVLRLRARGSPPAAPR